MGRGEGKGKGIIIVESKSINDQFNFKIIKKIIAKTSSFEYWELVIEYICSKIMTHDFVMEMQI